MRALMSFRSDLRISDNTALHHACGSADVGVIAFFPLCSGHPTVRAATGKCTHRRLAWLVWHEVDRFKVLGPESRLCCLLGQSPDRFQEPETEDAGGTEMTRCGIQACTNTTALDSLKTGWPSRRCVLQAHFERRSRMTSAQFGGQAGKAFFVASCKMERIAPCVRNPGNRRTDAARPAADQDFRFHGSLLSWISLDFPLSRPVNVLPSHHAPAPGRGIRPRSGACRFG